MVWLRLGFLGLENIVFGGLALKILVFRSLLFPDLGCFRFTRFQGMEFFCFRSLRIFSSKDLWHLSFAEIKPLGS